MPYEWIPPAGPDAPRAELHLWPYRSLPRRGMVWFLGGTAGLIALPLIVVIGSPILWGLLPFFGAAVGGIWWALNRSFRDGEVLEELRILEDRMTLVRYNPRGPRQDWEANPHWVRPVLHALGGPERRPVKNYLTLAGGPREVELGAFLAEDERRALYGEVADHLDAARAAPRP